MAQYPHPSSLSAYASVYDPAAEGLTPPVTGLCGAAQQVGTDYVQTAFDILKDIAKRGMQHPHKMPEAEIKILAAFVLGHNFK
jgi:hypothetical protein